MAEHIDFRSGIFVETGQIGGASAPIENGGTVRVGRAFAFLVLSAFWHGRFTALKQAAGILVMS